MADNTYNNQAVYHKQQGNEIVIASGGKGTIESGGELELQSGALMDLQSGFTFYLGSSTYSVTLPDLLKALYAANNVTTYAQGAVSTVLSVSQIYTKTKYLRLSMTSTMPTETIWFASAPSVGMEMMIIIAPGSSVSGYVVLSASTGVSLVTLAGSDISQIKLYNSTNSRGFVRLACVNAGEWAVVGISTTTSATFA